MKRILITDMSGTGKSTVVAELAAGDLVEGGGEACGHDCACVALTETM